MSEAARTDDRLAVLTRSDSGFGVRFLTALREQGVRPAVLGVEDTPFSKRWRMFKRLGKRIGWIDGARYQRRFWTPVAKRAVSGGRWAALQRYEGAAERVVRAPTINEPSIAGALRAQGVTRVILAQSGIVRDEILGIDGIEVFNAHPAILPGFRGVDVVRWTLRAGEPVGATIHLVDRGVDTGGILRTETIDIRSTDRIVDVEQRAADRCMDLLLRAAMEGRAAFGAPRPQDASVGEQVFLMPFAVAAQLERDWPRIRSRYIDAAAPVVSGVAHA